MLRTRRTPKDRAAFPTELPSGLRIPAGVSPETFASHRDILSVLLLRFMTSRLRAMYQAYDGDLTLCLVLGEIASRNTERFYDERRGYQPASFNGQRQYLPCNHQGHHKGDFSIQDDKTLPAAFEILTRYLAERNAGD